MSKLVTISGVVTRLVPEDPEKGIGAKVFFRPDDASASAIRDLDGKHQTASGEVHLFADVEGRALGDVCEMLWDVEDLQRSPKLQPPGRHKSTRKEKRDEAAERARLTGLQTEPPSFNGDDEGNDKGNDPKPPFGGNDPKPPFGG